MKRKPMMLAGETWAIRLMSQRGHVVVGCSGELGYFQVGQYTDPNPKSRRQRFFRCKYVPHEVI